MSEVIERETMEFDVIIVGAGPAGLSCAIKLKQLNAELNIVVLEKAAEVGGHILSGAILETRALDELLPDWQNMNAPITTKVSNDQIIRQKDEKIKTLLQQNETDLNCVRLCNEKLNFINLFGYDFFSVVVTDNSTGNTHGFSNKHKA